MKRIISMTIILALCISLCSCSAKWTDEDITKSTKIEITKYAGFMFANDMLYFTEPGYTANLVLSLRYRDFMEKWFGADFKLWYEDRQGKSEVVSA